MKNYTWLIISGALSLFNIIYFFPKYEGSEYPLFLDITTLSVFIPSLFILFYGVIPIVLQRFSLNKKYLLYIKTFLYIATFIISLNFLDFYQLEIRIIISLVGILVAVVYRSLTIAVFNRLNSKI